MTSPSPLLPPPPPNFQRFAWNNLPLLLPLTWNLRSHLGTPHRGALLFADLTQIRLELRWQSAPRLWPLRPNPTRLLTRTLARLKRGQGSFSTHPLYTEFRQAHSTTLLLTHEHQLLELHWPATSGHAPPEHLSLIAPDFATSLRLRAASPTRLWSVYGAQGDIPRALSPHSLSMLPGHTRLNFRSRFPHARRIILGSYSRADHLLATQSLPQWAAQTFPFLQPRQNLPWQLSPDHAQLSLPIRQGPLRRRFTHTLTLHHDQPHNRIQYTHTTHPSSQNPA